MAEMQFTVTVNYDRTQGKFAGRDEIAETIEQALQEVDIDISGIGADGDSEYEVSDVSAFESTPPQGYDTAVKRVREFIAAFAALNPENDVVHGLKVDGKTYKLNVNDLRKLVNR